MKQTRADLTESGIPWVGKVPAHWTAKPLWALFERIKDVDHPEEQMLSVFRDHGVVAKDSRDNLNRTAENRSIYQLVHPGWLVANRMKAWQGSVGISSLRGIVSGHYICFAPRHKEDNRYLNWLLRSTSYANGYALLSRGVRIGQAEIDNDKFRQMLILLPPSGEQRAIADYLDRETARIDTLIDEQRRLIEMLRERRIAVVAHATSDGSEVEFRRVISDLRQGWSPNCENTPADGVFEWGVLKVGCANTGRFDPAENKRLPDDQAPRPEFAVRRGDLVMSRSNTKDLVGAAAVIDGDYPRLLLSDLTYSISLTAEAHPGFVAYALRSPRMRAQISAASKGMSHSMQKISQRDIRELRLQLPALDEQRRIAHHLDEQTAKIDALIAETERFIELSKERRSALVTAAVTGKIDVREAA